MFAGMDAERLVFFFFLFSFFGWLFELFLEALAGRGFVNRGFFYGPVVPIYAAGFFLAYAVCYPLRSHPLLVFFTSAAACTALEYATGWALEKYLKVRAWDYDIHPLTFWCNYKKRIAFTASLSFGLFTLATIYVLWDGLSGLADFLGTKTIRVLDAVFLSLFLTDAVFSFRKYMANKKSGGFTAVNGVVDYDKIDAGFFERTTQDILTHPLFLKSKDYIQHGKTSVFQHSLCVAEMCCILSRFWKVKDRAGMVRAALLHDFFLYDWHSEWKLTHGFTHPIEAAENAHRYFNVSDKEYSLIRTHMWPFTLFHPPKHKEGWFICIADKIVSFKEILRVIPPPDPDTPCNETVPRPSGTRF
ncbi:MAG: hypothetical protein LBO04_06735 [Spirochaetaceae bacterium]|jgi:uncharacterized protein|nr:hypothetical protein [Spirochaetaceae bacterium]